LFIGAPEQRTAKLSNKFPAGNLPSICGWLVHVNTSLHLLQVDLIVNIVPDCEMGRSGLLAKHKLQDGNKISSFDRNTIAFGSSL